MKKWLSLTLMSVLATVLYAQEREIFIPSYDKEPDDEPVELFTPYETVSSGRELPRSFTVSYPDEESALEGSPASLYIQPMDDAPQVTDGGDHYQYTWTYKMPFAWVGRLVMLYIGSADNAYSVYINGQEAGVNESGRSTAEFDITALSNEGLNTLSVRVGKNPASAVLTSSPGTGKVTGHVLVHSQPRIRVRDYVAQANFSAEEPTLQLGIILKTHMLNARMVRIHYSLTDRNGLTVASGHRDAEVGLKEEDTVRFFTPARDLLPWTYETPHMYDLVIKNQYEGRYTEYVRYRVGFRTLLTAEGELLSDGYRLPLAIYEMPRLPEQGNLPEALAGIKSNGYNMVMAGGYPQSERFYELCDSLGLYVCVQADVNTSAAGESRGQGGNPSNDPWWAASFVDRALTMHGTLANHPSAAMFSIARSSANGYNLYESYIALKQREIFRPVIYPESAGEWNSDAVTADFAARHPDAVEGRLVLDTDRQETAYPDRPYTALHFTQDGMCTVENHSLVTRLRGTVTYTIKKGMKKVGEGSLPVTVEPGSSVELEIPTPEGGKKLKYEARLDSNFDGFGI